MARKQIPVKYFSHRTFKDFFKRVRGLGYRVYIYYEVNNSIGLPQYLLKRRLKLRTLEHELWENNATHHYIINQFIDIEIPADAELMHVEDCFGYVWRDGPTNFFIISLKKIKMTIE